MRTNIIILSLVFAASVANAQQPKQQVKSPAAALASSFVPDPDKEKKCAAIDEKIEFQIKLMAMDYVMGIADTSVPRETNRYLKRSAALQTIALHLQTADALQCASRNKVLEFEKYNMEAFACRKVNYSSESSECKLQNWKGATPAQE